MIKYLMLFFITVGVSAEICDDHRQCKFKFFNNKSFLTYFSTHNLNKLDNNIERLVVVVHGALRNGHEYFDDTVKAAKKFNVQNKTLVIAPTFRKVTDEREVGELYWGRNWRHKWKYGFDSQDQDHVSSFIVLDKLILKINNSNNFPNLKTIVVTGHSAGGQFTQRYAIASKIRLLINTHIRFVPSNPSSYMYLDNERFYFTNGSYVQRDINTSCDEYNHYIYGPEQRPSIFKGSIDDLKENFKNNEVVYLMSEEDKGTDSLDRSCEAMLQGENRFERALNYWYYSKNYLSSKNHSFTSVPGIGHEHVDVYESQNAKEVVFGIQ